MPRRKRSTGQNERRRKIRRRENNNDDDDEEDNNNNNNDNTTLVISDSESDEVNEEDCVMKVTPRAARRREREKRALVQDMTEDEMLDLALRLSKQEANSANQREQVEDDNVRKAIAESLQVSCCQTSETSSKRVRPAAKPHQDRDTVTAHVRCKLSFPSKDGKDSGSDDDVSATHTSALKGSEEVSPLPPMPDLSQRTLSQPSPPSPTLTSVPSAASQESHSSRLDKQEIKVHSPESEGSPIFVRQCSVRLNQNFLSPRGSSGNTSVALTSPDRSQNSPPPPKSPVFPMTDSKRCTKLTRDKFSDCTSLSSFTDRVCKPEDTFQESSSHKSRGSLKRLARSRTAQPSSSPVSGPEDDRQEGVQLQQVKEESSRGAGLRTVSVADRAPNSDVSSPAATKPLDEFTSHMVLHLSDDDDDDDEEKIIPPSPVFPQDRASHTSQRELSPTQPCFSPPTAVTTHDSFQTKSPSHAESEQPKVSRTSSDSRLSLPVERKEERLVSYYWGIPFCPKGQSPDDYTRVILAQLEVYEKSLKEAQRHLLHKAEWGLPVFPCPVERPHGRRLKRHRAPQLLEEEEEEDNDKGRDKEEKEKKKKADWKEREESRTCLEEGAENVQHETYVVVSSPETQEELGKSPLLFRHQESTNPAKPSSCRKPVSQDLSEATQIESEPDENGEEAQNGRFDVESTVCPETQITEDNTPELMVTSPAQLQAENDVMEVDEVMEQPAEGEERMEQEEEERPGEEQSWRESVPSQVECPMCTRLFPLSKIEMHAAYCNGTVEDQDEQDNHSEGSARRKGIRRTAMEDNVRFEKSEQREKCFLCSKFFTNKEYSHHVDQCYQQKTLGKKRGNGLLSALNRTETVQLDDSGAGPSNTTIKNNHGLADASVMPSDSADSQTLSYYVGSSPIKSFTPISELTDCLINFHQQYSDRNSQRLGRKRKFKR
ncbi:BRCA1-A complex subunit RAP80 isoform X2 [Neoarius graeffei]|uniref:BRCA1-A complex subunit RAP80 isoform X2 n=1 Tax=Neoarius graeffei TaxID=443677 RepID=UPI00298CA0E3|nr:BRCA1-A complex subunit RAP80 isoform X2 [Neoarius graeffei]